MPEAWPGALAGLVIRIHLLPQAVEIVEGMLQDGLIVISDVDVIRLVHPSSTLEVIDAGSADR